MKMWMHCHILYPAATALDKEKEVQRQALRRLTSHPLLPTTLYPEYSHDKESSSNSGAGTLECETLRACGRSTVMANMGWLRHLSLAASRLGREHQ